MSLDDLARRLTAAERKVAGLDLDNLAIRVRRLGDSRRMGWIAALEETQDQPAPGPPGGGNADCILKFLGCSGIGIPGVKANVTIGGQPVAALTSNSDGFCSFRGAIGLTYSVPFSKSRFNAGTASVTIAADAEVKNIQMGAASKYFCFKDCPIPIFSTLAGSDPFGSFTADGLDGISAGQGSRVVSGFTMANAANCTNGVTVSGTATCRYEMGGGGSLTFRYITCPSGTLNGYILDGSSIFVGGTFASLTSAAPDSYTCAPFTATWTFAGGNTLKVFGTSPASVTFSEF
jgi:hypothetical protein